MVWLSRLLRPCAILLGCLLITTAGHGQAGSGYTPAAPPAAMVAALRSQYNVVRDWVDQRDFASASQALGCLRPLADLAALQNDHADWAKGLTEVRGVNERLGDAVRKKDAASANKALAEANTVLEALLKVPAPEKRTIAGFKFPGGSVKQWMSMLDGAYVDAKSAKTAKDFELLAGALAEEGNALAYMRTDARWKSDSTALRDTAVKAAEQARAGDFEGARKAIKGIYASCESCHQRAAKK